MMRTALCSLTISNLKVIVIGTEYCSPKILEHSLATIQLIRDELNCVVSFYIVCKRCHSATDIVACNPELINLTTSCFIKIIPKNKNLM